MCIVVAGNFPNCGTYPEQVFYISPACCQSTLPYERSDDIMEPHHFKESLQQNVGTTLQGTITKSIVDIVESIIPLQIFSQIRTPLVTRKPSKPQDAGQRTLQKFPGTCSPHSKACMMPTGFSLELLFPHLLGTTRKTQRVLRILH